MSIESRYPIKYPYANEPFHKSLKDDLNRSSEIPKFEEYGNNHNRKSKQLDTVKKSVLENSSFANPALFGKLLTFLDTIFSLGSDRVLKNNPGEKLGDKIENHLDEIFKVADIEVGTEIPDEHGTGKDTDLQGSPTEQSIALTEEQKLHGKGLVMNFLRDYVLEKNFLQLAAENTIVDATGTSWTSSAVSLTGNHTKAVNSDSYQEPKNGSRILGLVADGVSHCPNPIDDVEMAKLKAGSEAEFTLEGELDPNKALIDALFKKDSDSYGSHYFSKLVGQEVNEFVVPATVLCDGTDSDLTPQATTTAQKLIKEPNYFWSVLVPHLFENKFISYSTENFFQDVSSCLEDGEWKSYLNQIQYPDLDLALKNKEVQQYLVAMMPLSQHNFSPIAREFAEVFQEKGKSISTATHLSYAMDLGDKIALVRIGDSPIKAFDFEGTTISGTNNISFKKEVQASDEKLNKQSQNIIITINRTRNPKQTPEINIPDNRVVIELVDKAKVAYIAIASDGISEKKDFNKNISNILSNAGNLSSKEVINKALELSTDRDDRTMVVLKRNS